jgi:REP element-mobilizing transposase RayT
MPHSFTQILIHYVFAPQGRFPVIKTDKQNLIINYIAGICHNYDCHLICGNAMLDHVHLLVSIPAKHSVAEIAKVIKANTSRFINTQTDNKFKFAWQEGYGAFSCSYSMLETIKQYIQNQEEHHKKISFDEEYRSLLLKHNIEVPS